MKEALQSICNNSYSNYNDFMRQVVNAGFDDDFSNAAIIAEISKTIDKIWQKLGTTTPVTITAELGVDCALIVHVIDRQNRHQHSLKMYTVQNKLCVINNAFSDTSKNWTSSTEVAYPNLDLQEALQFLTNLQANSRGRLSANVITLCKATHSAVAPTDYPNQCLVTITVSKKSMHMTFKLRQTTLAIVEVPFKETKNVSITANESSKHNCVALH